MFARSELAGQLHIAVREAVACEELSGQPATQAVEQPPIILCIVGLEHDYHFVVSEADGKRTIVIDPQAGDLGQQIASNLFIRAAMRR